MNTPCRVKPDESVPIIGIVPASEVVQIIKTKDAELAQLRTDLAQAQERIAQMQIDYVALEVAHDAIEEQLKQYQRMAARR